jgi:hypothetical protein
VAPHHAHTFATMANNAARPGMEINFVDPFHPRHHADAQTHIIREPIRWRCYNLQMNEGRDVGMQ